MCVRFTYLSYALIRIIRFELGNIQPVAVGSQLNLITVGKLKAKKMSMEIVLALLKLEKKKTSSLK